MNVFFDNCTPPAFASTLHGFIQHSGHAAYHIMEIEALPKGRNSEDVEWMEYLQKSGEAWIFISADMRIQRNPPERAALRAAGLHGFILARAWEKSELHQTAAMLIWKWPEILQVTQLVAAPSMHEIPIGKNTKLRQLPI